jgi:O-methyltransferase
MGFVVELNRRKKLVAKLKQVVRAGGFGSYRVLTELKEKEVAEKAEFASHFARLAEKVEQTARGVEERLSFKIEQTARGVEEKLSLIEKNMFSASNEQRLEIQRMRWKRNDAGASSQSAELYLDLLESILTGMLNSDEALSSVGNQAYVPVRRTLGRDWPASAETMIGRARMRNLRVLLESAIQLGIPGDFIETGVWRGGACIYARAILKASGDTVRKVYVADSFRGLPPPNASDYPADAGDTHWTYSELAISRQEVEENFRRYGLFDERVVFIEGWFKDTLPSAPIDKLCVLRLDGDLYESTIVALDALYRKVSPGGFVIVDDYLLPACAQAVEEFRTREGITAPLQPIDGAAVWWQVSGAESHRSRTGSDQ